MSANEPMFTDHMAPGDALPPVRPPTTGFFVQLFVMPALIVFGVLIVYYLFGKLSGEVSIDEYMRNLRSSEEKVRWKAALDLAWVLRHDSEYARDPALADQLSQALGKAISQSTLKDSESDYAEYLAGALGNLALPTGRPVLCKAIGPDLPKGVRRGGLISLAKLAERLGDSKDPAVAQAVRDCLTDNDAEIREHACFALGFVGDDESIGPLTARLDDPAASVRYNAAAALARLGSDKCVPVLREMLSPDALGTRLLMTDDVDQSEPDRQLVGYTILQGLASTRRLHRAFGSAAVAPLVEPIRELSKSENQALAIEAKKTLALIGQQPDGSPVSEPNAISKGTKP